MLLLAPIGGAFRWWGGAVLDVSVDRQWVKSHSRRRQLDLNVLMKMETVLSSCKRHPIVWGSFAQASIR